MIDEIIKITLAYIGCLIFLILIFGIGKVDVLMIVDFIITAVGWIVVKIIEYGINFYEKHFYNK